MITSTKTILKKPKKTKNPDRTLGQMVKAKLYRQNHTKSAASCWDDIPEMQVHQVDSEDLICCS